MDNTLCSIGFNNRLLGLFRIIPFFLLSLEVYAQSSYVVPNGDFEENGNAHPCTQWISIDGTVCRNSQNLGACTISDTQTGCAYNNTMNHRSAPISVTNTPQELDGATFQMPYCIGSNDDDDTYTISVELYDQTGGLITEFVESGNAPAGGFQCDNLQYPPIIGTLTPQTTQLNVRISSTAYSAFDNIGPIAVTIGDSGSTGNEPDIPTEEEQAIIDAANQAYQDAIDAINNFDCGDPLSAIVPQSAGGGSGFSVLFSIFTKLANIDTTAIAQLQQQMAQSCEAIKQSSLQELVVDALTEPQQNSSIPVAIEASNPLDEDLRNAADNSVGLYPVGSDDLVTAANKTNRLLIASAKLNAEAWDRALGGQRKPYEVEGGPLITQEIIDLEGESLQAVFAEGDYQGTKEKLAALSIDSGPDYESSIDISEQIPEAVGQGVCLVSDVGVYPEEGTAVEKAKWRMRWNAVNTLGASSMGAFICSVVERSVRNVGDVCLMPDGLNLQGTQVLPPPAMCIYGNSSPSYLTPIYVFLQVLTMFVAAWSVARMFIG